MSKLKVLTLTLAVAATIVVNILANALPFNGQNTAIISNKYFSYFTPAGITFAIWGVIYVGWIGYVIYHWRKRKDNSWLAPALPWFLLNCVANMLWLVLWHYEQLGVSVIVMLVLLVSLIKVYLLTRTKEVTDRSVNLLVRLPISIYLGWISVATIANIASALVQVNWGALGVSGEIWSAGMIFVALVLGVLMILHRQDYAFATVIIWALLGIAVNFQGRSEVVFASAVLAIIVLVLIVAFRIIQKARERKL